MAPLFEQCTSASGANRAHFVDRGLEAGVLLLGEVEVGGVGVGEVREHARDLDVGGVLGEGAQQLGQPVGADSEPPHPRVDLHVHAPTTADACGRARHRVDAFVVVDGGLDAFGDERVVAAGIAAADDQHGDSEVGDVERLGRRRHAEPGGAARDRGLGGEADAVPVAVRLHHGHHPHVAAHVLDDRGGVGADGRRVDLDALARRERARPRQACEPVRRASAPPTDRAGCRRRARARFPRRPRRWWRTPRPRGRWRR